MKLLEIACQISMIRTHTRVAKMQFMWLECSHFKLLKSRKLLNFVFKSPRNGRAAAWQGGAEICSRSGRGGESDGCGGFNHHCHGHHHFFCLLTVFSFKVRERSLAWKYLCKEEVAVLRMSI